MKLYLRLWPFFKKHWLKLFWVFFNVALFSLANIAFLALVRDLSEDIERGNIGLFTYRIGSGVVLALVRSAASYGQRYNMDWVAIHMIMSLRVKIYEHLQKLSLDFYSKWKIGEIMSRSTNDLQVVQGVFVSNIVTLIPELFTFLGVLIYLFILNWQLLLMTFITLPVFAFLIQRFTTSMRRISSYNQKKMADISSMLQETIYGIGIVKAFAREQHEIDRYTKENERSFWISMKSSRLYAIQDPILFMLQVTMILLIFMVGGIQIIQGNLSVGNFIAFCTGLAMLVNPITMLGQVSTKQQQAMAALERVYEILDIEPSVKDPENPTKLDKIEGSVEFDAVSFRYQKNGNQILNKVSLKVEPGQIMALVGSSGAGKTTLVNLIPRFYDVTEGAINIDGINVKEFSFESLRSKIGIVTQETILFSGSIKDNIAYGKPEATQQEIEEAARVANAHEFIKMFPSGYNTVVGERGVRLSGGQRQRIAIARAILSDPRILILDEATSALDTESEKLVQQALEILMKGRTTFVIAHRLSTVINADRILVMDNGEVAGIDSHEELLKTNPIYQKLYNIQFLGQQVD